MTKILTVLYITKMELKWVELPFVFFHDYFHITPLLYL